MNYSEYLKFCLDAALDIKAGNFDKGCGICGNMEYKVIHAVHVKFPGYVIEDDEMDLPRILKKAFYSWPKFSGDVGYPISDPYNEMLAQRAYHYLPKWVGEYGELRFELLDHIINFIEKEIENAEHAEHTEAAERST